ncbi:MAG: ribonuclease III [Chloroflexi bacterium]|nr:ribonuclease III [Chloroflexota bacterium]
MANLHLDDATLERLEARLGYQFNDRSLLAHALVHRSLVNEADLADEDCNERLEFLGDAALGLVAAELLYRRYPDRAEGRLTHARASLVNLETLGEMGGGLGLGEFVQLGRGEDLSGGRERRSVVGRALEAVLGAVYLDQGLDALRELLNPILIRELDLYGWEGPAKDFKSQLQEHMQAKQDPTPVYELVATQGPDHHRLFTMAVRSGEAVLASGEGSSKQRAEQAAARAALTAMLEAEGRPDVPAAD